MTNYLLLLTLIIFFLIYCNLNKIKEKFENIDETVCIDENTKEIRKTSKEEQKTIKKEKQKNVEKKKKIEKSKRQKQIEKEVFLIYGSFTYLEAKEICKLYKGTLATFEQLQDAFNNGANWCHWGWLNDETVAYPIQEEYWNNIEKIHKGYCGPTAGINRIKNINLLQKFSINCFGIKPKQTKKDKENEKKLELNINKYDSLTEQIRKCKKEKQIERQKELVSKLKKNVVILSFNKKKWSIF